MSEATVLSARIQNAAKIVSQYYGDHTVPTLYAALNRLGVDNTDIGLSILEGDLISFDDFQTFLLQEVVDTSIDVPTPRLKLVWNVLKGVDSKAKPTPTKSEEDVTSTLEALIKANRPIQQWSNLELLEQYTKDCQLIIHEELARRAKNRCVIVFNEDGSVDIETSLHLLKKSQFQETPQTYKVRNGDIREVYRVGEFPMQVFYECPVHADVLLLDGYCEECSTYWDLDDKNRNAFLRLLVEKEKLDIRLYKEKTFEELKSLFPKVYLVFKDLSEEERLPSLKRKISKPKPGDPFRVVGTHKSY